MSETPQKLKAPPIFSIKKIAHIKQKYFVFKGKKYPFNYDLFKQNSDFFYENQNLYDDIELIDLFQEDESLKLSNISDSAINNFISLSQNEQCQIEDCDLFYINYLSRKYKVNELTSILSDYISQNRKDLFFESFLFNFQLYNTIKNNDSILSFISEDDKLIMSANLIDYINDSRILTLPISILYEILAKFYFQREKNSSENKENDQKIIEFLFKCLDKYGSDASILFSLIDKDKISVKTIEKLYNNYFEIFDFAMINQTLLNFTMKFIKIDKEKSIFQKKFIMVGLEISQQFEIKDFRRFTNKQKSDNKFDISFIQKEIKDDNPQSFLHFSEIKIIEVIQNDNDDDVFIGFDSSMDQFLNLHNAISINDFSFYENSSITQVFIPLSVISIGYKSFAKCSSITKVIIPSSVISIDDYAFSDCTSLVKITIPSSLSSIGNFVFAGCSSLKEISIPSSVMSIGENAFSDCTSLEKLTMNPYMTKIEENTFHNCSSLKYLNISDEVTSTQEYNFKIIGSITNITLPTTITKISESSFCGMTTLKTITIPTSVTTIGRSSFNGCSSLTDIVIPSSVKKYRRLCI